jgi:hypothetical protein
LANRPFVTRLALPLALAVALAGAAACGGAPGKTHPHAEAVPRPLASPESALADPFLDSLEWRTFRFFWDQTDSATGLSPDRWPTPSFVSVAAVGFALNAYPIGAERGWVTREAAANRALATLRWFWRSPQDTARAGATGSRGFFYHFLDAKTGARFENVELSTVDTGLFLMGALFCQSYFDRATPAETELRALADSLAERVDWRWAAVRPPSISHGWTPEEGLLPYDWKGYSEAMLVNLLALGSKSHGLGRDTWDAWCKSYLWGGKAGQEHVGFAPLFGHQYTHVWVDFRGIQDDYTRAKGIDYFENSRRATLLQRDYAIANPHGWRGYGERLWGLTACDGALEAKLTIDGKERQFKTYEARGATFGWENDDGTVAPTAMISSLPFAPEVVAPAILALRDDHGEHGYRVYGFVDAINPTLHVPTKVQTGTIVPGVGWYDVDYLGIDQGPILAMIENQRSGLVWKTMRKNATLVRGLKKAGFKGGWLDQVMVHEDRVVPRTYEETQPMHHKR